MYHPFIEAAAMTLVDIPITLATLIPYSILVYFAVGLQESASHMQRYGANPGFYRACREGWSAQIGRRAEDVG